MKTFAEENFSILIQEQRFRHIVEMRRNSVNSWHLAISPNSTSNVVILLFCYTHKFGLNISIISENHN